MFVFECSHPVSERTLKRQFTLPFTPVHAPVRSIVKKLSPLHSLGSTAISRVATVQLGRHYLINLSFSFTQLPIYLAHTIC